MWLVLLAALFAVTTALAHGSADWIAKGRYVSPIDGQHCCGEHDCFEVPSDQVTEVTGGLSLWQEFVPWREVQPSKDGNYWRCRKPDGSRRCIFAPLPST